MEILETQVFELRKLEFMKGVSVKVVNSFFFPGVDAPKISDVRTQGNAGADRLIITTEKQFRHMQ